VAEPVRLMGRGHCWHVSANNELYISSLSEYTSMKQTSASRCRGRTLFREGIVIAGKARFDERGTCAWPSVLA